MKRSAISKQLRVNSMEFRDLKKQYKTLKSEIDSAIQEVIDSGAFILGEKINELEEKLAKYVGRKHCVAVGNGTDALHLALKALDIGVGDAVFATDFTYVASAVCAYYVGATPVLVDIDERTFNISPESLELAIQEVLKEGKLKPKVIIPVDLFGLPADYERIDAIAKKYNLYVLEDAAQGFGGRIKDKKACSFGDISTTSFFPAKPLGCYGDGGAIFTDDEDTDKYLRSVRALGKSPVDKYDNYQIGINSRLDSLQAAILLPKFEAFKSYELDRVNQIAQRYSKRLKGHLETPLIPEGYLSSYAQYTILLDDSEQREKIQNVLKEKNIPSMVYYPRCMHQQRVFKELNLNDEMFPISTDIVTRCLSLPIGPYLSLEEVDMVSDTLLAII